MRYRERASAGLPVMFRVGLRAMWVNETTLRFP
jgi:hypothetical protein